MKAAPVGHTALRNASASYGSSHLKQRERERDIERENRERERETENGQEEHNSGSLQTGVDLCLVLVVNMSTP